MGSLKSKIGVVIVGASGYGAKEFLRLAANHPYIEVLSLISSNKVAKNIGDLHPSIQNLNTQVSMKFDPQVFEAYSNKIVILALPHEASLEWIECNHSNVLRHGICLIDLSGAFRLSESKSRKKHYSIGADEIANQFVFGLPELNRSAIQNAQFISNPGCYPTSAILALLFLKKLPTPLSIYVDGKSGSSGAGRTPSPLFHHPESHANLFAYNIGTHRHQPEIIEHAKISSKTKLEFCPHVIPCSRGLITTSYISFNEKIDELRLIEQLKESTQNEPFFFIKDTPPHLHNVVGSNRCDVHYKVLDSTVIAISVIDNLIKGMAGQAIQNINIRFGIPEETGLPSNGWGIT